MSSFYGTFPANGTAKWHPEPPGRGTFGILSSCLITMALCVWTAVHLNIPEKGQTGIFTPQMRRKIIFLLIGLFAPELITWIAFEQRRTASRIYKMATKRITEQSHQVDVESQRQDHAAPVANLRKSKSTARKDEHEWTMVHSYYVAMGGFAIDMSDEKLCFLALKEPYHFMINEIGFKLLAECDLIPSISKAEILDKSKANGLAKLLACVQASWFCIQCIGRLAQKLTVSLLEVNTFAHALCTLLTYMLWWNKPLDIEEPTRITLPSETAAMFLLQTMSAKSGRKFQGDQDERNIWSNYTYRDEDESDLDLDTVDTDVAPDKIELPRSFIIHETQFRASTYGRNPGPLYLTRAEFECFKIALEEAARRDVWIFHGSVLCLRVDDWPHSRDRRSAIASFIFASLCYGGLHLTGWYAPFPTVTQRTLWQISSLTLATYAPLVGGVASLYAIRRYIWRYILKYIQDFILFFFNGLKALAIGFIFPLFNRFIPKSYINPYKVCRVPWDCFILVVFSLPKCFVSLRIHKAFGALAVLYYIFCRVYLLVECFITVAHLPDSVYEVPQWSQYFPHVG